MDINTKLGAIQHDLKAPKTQFNSFGKYHYRNCEDILEAVKPLLAKYNATLTITDEIVLVGERYYVKATATLRHTGNSSREECYIAAKDTISNTAFAREELSKAGMDGSQITGSASSYARKYALNGLFAIDDTKDADTTNTGDEAKPTTKAKTPREQLIVKLQEKGIDVNEYAKEHGLSSKTTAAEFKKLLAELEG
jgi:DNA-binding NarL/FixJ family response regulator